MQSSEGRETHMQRIPGDGTAEGPPQTATSKMAMANDPQQGSSEAIPTRASDQRKDCPMQTQRAPTKKRQRSIFEFAKISGQVSNTEATANKGEDRMQVDAQGKQDNKKPKIFAEWQERGRQSQVNQAPRTENEVNINQRQPMKQ